MLISKRDKLYILSLIEISTRKEDECEKKKIISINGIIYFDNIYFCWLPQIRF